MLSKESSPESIPTCSGTLKMPLLWHSPQYHVVCNVAPLAGQRFQKAVLLSPIFRLTDLSCKRRKNDYFIMLF